MDENQDEQVYAFISDGDIFHFMTIPNSDDLSKSIAGLNSKPLVLNVTEIWDDMRNNPSAWKYDEESGKIFLDEELIDPDLDYEVED